VKHVLIVMVLCGLRTSQCYCFIEACAVLVDALFVIGFREDRHLSLQVKLSVVALIILYSHTHMFVLTVELYFLNEK
jgi:hypothetical protein